jgi:hypothetical protein
MTAPARRLVDRLASAHHARLFVGRQAELNLFRSARPVVYRAGRRRPVSARAGARGARCGPPGLGSLRDHGFSCRVEPATQMPPPDTAAVPPNSGRASRTRTSAPAQAASMAAVAPAAPEPTTRMSAVGRGSGIPTPRVSPRGGRYGTGLRRGDGDGCRGQHDRGDQADGGEDHQHDQRQGVPGIALHQFGDDHGAGNCHTQ